MPNAPTQRNLRRRLAIKLAIFGFVSLAALYPRPDLLWRQAGNLSDLDALIDSPFPELSAINDAIDGNLTANATELDELQSVERFVTRRIDYEYDWDNWLNVDYWPTAAEVWERGREDCDGRAILAAAILRARGFEDVAIVGSMNHIWVRAGEHHIMGPEDAATLLDEAGGFRLALPSMKQALTGAAFVGEFPVPRTLLIWAVALTLCHHPCRRLSGFLVSAAMGLAGFLLLLAWSPLYLRETLTTVDFNFVLGAELLLASFALTAFMPQTLARLEREWRDRARRPTPVAPSGVSAVAACDDTPLDSPELSA